MRGRGIMLLIIGLGSFVLPKLGMQFMLISIFGEYEMFAAIIMAIAGGLMVVFGGGSKIES